MIYRLQSKHIDTGRLLKYFNSVLCISATSFNMSNVKTCSKGVVLSQDTFGQIQIDGKVETIKRFTWINSNKVSINTRILLDRIAIRIRAIFHKILKCLF